MPDKATVVFIDDDERVVTALAALFEARYRVIATTDPHEVLARVQRERVHVVLSGLRMPAMSGIDLLRGIRNASPQTTRLLLSDFTDLATAVLSISSGDVYRFLRKPWDADELRGAIAQAAALSLAAGAALSAPTEAPAVAAKAVADILVIDDCDADFSKVEAALGSRYRLHRAITLDMATRLLARECVGVILTDVWVGVRSTSTFLKAVRQHAPEVVSLVQATPQGTRNLVDLINQAQVFRFLSKPTRPTVLEAAVNAAMQRHVQLATAARRRLSGSATTPAASSSNASASPSTLLQQIRERARV